MFDPGPATLSPQDTLAGATLGATMGATMGQGREEGRLTWEGAVAACSRAGKRGLTVCRSFFRPSATWVPGALPACERPGAGWPTGDEATQELHDAAHPPILPFPFPAPRCLPTIAHDSPPHPGRPCPRPSACPPRPTLPTTLSSLTKYFDKPYPEAKVSKNPERFPTF